MDNSQKKDMITVLKVWLVWLALFLLWLIFTPSTCRAMDFKEYINMPITTTQTKGELRIEWNDFFGWDLFRPYFAIKDMEHSFTNFTALDMGKLKGRLRFGDWYKTVEYKFKYEF